MIAYIKGILTYIQDDAVIVDVQGIGYEIICANPFAFQESLNEDVTIHTYHHVREDMQVLYGFKNKDEKALFMKLISVSGIGPKGALGILSSVNIPDFVAAIEREDDKYLTSFPGVGKKTSRQIILDLKGKLTTLFSIGKPEETVAADLEVRNEIKEAQEALKALGYTEREIRTITPELQKENVTNTDEMIRKALALLMKN
ncbi:MAG TPA: Holliday junction branch migration protein RuvA [Candidatus Avamphibacillus sp.]|nr:Holliday junction branch migration protein RuvA [Candidatus Avamphibacillus sp.]